jgi:acyl-CoA reductase-like NAD-dependent aldehyde dehydrogenase
MGVGQFCTNPGVVVGIKSEGWSRFKTALVEALSSIPQGVMLTDGIAELFSHGCQALSALPGVEVLADHPGGKIFSTSADFPAEALHEVFGPSTLLIECESEAELHAVAHRFTGELTASIHWAEGDEAPAQTLASTLSLRVGRVIFNGFPTGVEVSPAMQHGGPYPASSDARFTSVGTAAIQRWLRPVAFQDAPDFISTNLPS